MLNDRDLQLRWSLLQSCLQAGTVTDLPMSAMLEQIDAELRQAAERSLHAFVQQSWHIIEPGTPFQDNWHVGAICDHLEAVTAGQITRLVITIPPRCLKSTIVSICWPAWIWTRRPSCQFLCLAHSDDNAVRDTRRMRYIVSADWYQSRWKLSFARDENLKASFLNDQGGIRKGYGILSQYQGANADVIILDDPNDRTQAHSDVKRAAVLDAYRETVTTRLNDVRTGCIVAIGQRLHHQDLIGFLIESGYDVLCIPMRYEHDHPYKTTTWWRDPRTCEGELMFPSRFSEQAVTNMEKPHNLGSWGFASQMQQRPSPKGGGMFKRHWFEIVPASPRQAVRVRAWDKASTAGGGDYTVGVRIAMADGIFYVEDVQREQVSPDQRHKLMLTTARLDADHDPATEIVIEREGGSSGKDAAMFETRLLAGFPVYCEHPSGSKETRAMPFASQCEAGNVRLVAGPWNAVYLDELCVFPVGKNDDQVDGSSSGFGWLTRDNVLNELARYDLIASGQDDTDSRPLTRDEIEEMPEFFRDLLISTAELQDGRPDRYRATES